MRPPACRPKGGRRREGGDPARSRPRFCFLPRTWRGTTRCEKRHFDFALRKCPSVSWAHRWVSRVPLAYLRRGLPHFLWPILTISDARRLKGLEKAKTPAKRGMTPSAVTPSAPCAKEDEAMAAPSILEEGALELGVERGQHPGGAGGGSEGRYRWRLCVRCLSCSMVFRCTLGILLLSRFTGFCGGVVVQTNNPEVRRRQLRLVSEPTCASLPPCPRFSNKLEWGVVETTCDSRQDLRPWRMMRFRTSRRGSLAALSSRSLLLMLASRATAI